MAEADTDAIGVDELAENKAAIVVDTESKDSNNVVNAELNADSEPTIPIPEVVEIGTTPNKQVTDENKLAHSNTTASDLFNIDSEEHSPAAPIKSFNTVEAQSGLIEKKANKATQKRETESSTIALNTHSADASVRLKQTPEQDESLQVGQDASQAIKSTPEKTKNYRSSALLWIIEIKHLYEEKKTDQAKEELALFRKKFPNNGNERLLHKEFLDTNPK